MVYEQTAVLWEVSFSNNDPGDGSSGAAAAAVPRVEFDAGFLANTYAHLKWVQEVAADPSQVRSVLFVRVATAAQRSATRAGWGVVCK